MARRTTADDLRLAAEWLDCYEPNTDEGERCARVAAAAQVMTRWTVRWAGGVATGSTLREGATTLPEGVHIELAVVTVHWLSRR